MLIEDIKGLVFISCKNAESYIENCIESLAGQTFQEFRICFVDDASTDKTLQRARKSLAAHFDNARYTVISNSESVGKARNAFEVLKKEDATFTAIVDGDDRLLSRYALEMLAEGYSQGFDVVWSNYVTASGKLGDCAPLDVTVSPRLQAWFTSHLFSFRQDLFHSIPETYLKDTNGEWFLSGCDGAIAYPILDQTRRYLFLNVPLYRYNDQNLASHHNCAGENVSELSSLKQRENFKQVVKKPALPLRRPFETHERSCQIALINQQRISQRILQNQHYPNQSIDDDQGRWPGLVAGFEDGEPSSAAASNLGGLFQICCDSDVVIKFQQIDHLDAYISDANPAVLLDVTTGQHRWTSDSAGEYSADPSIQSIGSLQFEYFDVSIPASTTALRTRLVAVGLPDQNYAVSAIPLVETAKKLFEDETYQVLLFVQDETDAHDICLVWREFYDGCVCETTPFGDCWLVSFCKLGEGASSVASAVA